MSREAFRQAAGFFVETASLISGDSWEGPGLGVWSLRELVGHTARALTNVETYATAPAERVELDHSAGYFLAFGKIPNVSETVAERGRQAGKELGSDPAKAVPQIAARVLKALDEMPDSLVIGTPVGGMTLNDYLETRILELTIHTLDIAAAIGASVEPPQSAMSVTLRLLAELAVRQGKGAQIAFAITGRRPLPQPFSLLV
ncbi:MAG: maleylpyruvate isomerase N-terminal domain-containing protein [Chloroflexi bacterium]|nr:maleylpyruvate isomerase N-terminal domain-containing protein [Chloroflexota bacterium]